MNNLRSGNAKSGQRAIAALCPRHETLCMKTNGYEADSEAYTLPCVDTAVPQITEADRTMSNRASRTGNSPGVPVVAGVATRRPFPVRTLMVCFTIWLIATQAMIFDQIKFDERAQLLDRATRSLGGPQVVVPTEPPLNLPTDAKVERL